MTAIAALETRLKEVMTLNRVASLLSWDQETMMPAGSGEARAEELALVQGMAHERFASEETGALIEAAGEQADNDEQRALVREAAREYRREVGIPTDLVKAWAGLTSRAQAAWRQAYNDGDWDAFAPWLEKLMPLALERAAAVDDSRPAYDVMLDGFEPGTTRADIDAVFARLRAGLVPLVAAIAERGEAEQRRAPLVGTFAADAQERLARAIVSEMGFDWQRGRLDIAVHPFCSGHVLDTRITTRYDESNPAKSLYGVIHETGHGLYEQGLPQDWAHTPMGMARSMAIHESQSRFWENMIGRSQSFWQRFGGLARTELGLAESVGVEQLFHAVNVVEPSFIRVDADECTYNLHIILRYELEQALVAGELTVADLPAAWNERSQALLGVTPPDPRRGVLQDVHWSMGIFGYFPTYALGNCYAAMFREAMSRDLDIDALVAAGELAPIKAWLNQHIHALGSRYTTADLVERVTGGRLAAEPLLAYLNTKFSGVYGL